mmetsp:Transcript_27169/g.68984  ORF Transcript_27169/g.68984 Transcript_27169/m.68984 type:complete len:235 (-) Transcript_27169:438-1142(-)
MLEGYGMARLLRHGCVEPVPADVAVVGRQHGPEGDQRRSDQEAVEADVPELDPVQVVDDVLIPPCHELPQARHDAHFLQDTDGLVAHLLHLSTLGAIYRRGLLGAATLAEAPDERPDRVPFPLHDAHLLRSLSSQDEARLLVGFEAVLDQQLVMNLGALRVRPQDVLHLREPPVEAGVSSQLRCLHILAYTIAKVVLFIRVGPQIGDEHRVDTHGLLPHLGRRLLHQRHAEGHA